MDTLNDELLERIRYNEDDDNYENGFVTWHDIEIILDRFRTPLVHDSDCGLHNEPAMPNTDCTCKMAVLQPCQQERREHDNPNAMHHHLCQATTRPGQPDGGNKPIP